MRAILRALDDVPAGSGAVVMGTGIVSAALLLDGTLVLSRILLALTAAAWCVLGGLLALRSSTNRERFLSEAHSPAGLTGVAGTAVLGTRITELGWIVPGEALLAVAFAGWCLLMPLVLRRLGGEHRGNVFMITVATEALAALAAVLAGVNDRTWLLYLAVALAAAGLVLWPLALRRFALAELRRGRGDQWVAGGSLAIAALALALCMEAARRLGASGSVHSILRDCALAVWAAAVMWVPGLLFAELRWRRPRYDVRRWATVFPLGMYAACSFAAAAGAHVAGIRNFASVWVWLAAAIWLLVFGGMLRSIVRSARRAIPSRPAAPRQRPAGSTTPPASYPPPAR